VNCCVACTEDIDADWTVRCGECDEFVCEDCIVDGYAEDDPDEWVGWFCPGCCPVREDMT